MIEVVKQNAEGAGGGPSNQHVTTWTAICGEWNAVYAGYCCQPDGMWYCGNWNFHTKELTKAAFPAFPGTKVPWVELSFLGTFVPWNFRSQEPSFPGTFVSMTDIKGELSFPNIGYYFFWL